MELYHGSYMQIERPRVRESRYTKDFGSGFYCTLLKRQAERRSRRFDTSWVNVYDYVETQELQVLEFREMTDDWLDFIVACRRGQSHSYDIVVGAMADDQIYNYVADFMAGILTRDQFWALARFKYPTHQMAFCTEASLTCLTFKSAYQI